MHTKSISELHTELLRAISSILNRHLDICDVLGDKLLTNNEKIEKINEINKEIGLICAETLPE